MPNSLMNSKEKVRLGGTRKGRSLEETPDRGQEASMMSGAQIISRKHSYTWQKWPVSWRGQKETVARNRADATGGWNEPDREWPERG